MTKINNFFVSQLANLFDNAGTRARDRFVLGGPPYSGEAASFVLKERQLADVIGSIEVHFTADQIVRNHRGTGSETALREILR